MIKVLKKIFKRKIKSSKANNDDDYNPVRGFENAAITFLNQKLYISSACIFINIIELNHKNSMAWYGLANSLYCLAGDRRDLNILEIALKCVLKSLKEDNDNKMAFELLEWIKCKTPLDKNIISKAQAFEAKPKIILDEVDFSPVIIAEDFAQLNTWQERMQIIMWLYGINEPYYGDILIKAISDENDDVKMAALKRIGAFGNRAEIKDKIENMLLTEEFVKIEPYFSIAMNSIQRSQPDLSEWVDTLTKKANEIKSKYKDN